MFPLRLCSNFFVCEQMVPTIARMTKINLNFLPKTQELIADRFAAQVLTAQNTAWSNAVDQRDIQMLWELRHESADAYLHERAQ